MTASTESLIKPLVIGGGVWGQALARAFASRGPLTLYSPHPLVPDLNDERIAVIYDYDHAGLVGSHGAAAEATHVFVVAPATAMREVCSNLRSRVSVDCTIIICAKGIEVETGKLMSEIVAEYLPENPVAVLSGPNFASEVAAGLPTLTSIAAPTLSDARVISKTFSTPAFGLVPCDNIVMAQIFGALKNVLAVLCGAARGLELGQNFIASMIAVGVREIMALGGWKQEQMEQMPKEEATWQSSLSSEVGSCPSTQHPAMLLLAPAGIGDIFLTCSSEESRNNRFGFELVTKHAGRDYKTALAELASVATGSASVTAKGATVEGLSTILALQSWKLRSPLLSIFSHALVTGQYRNADEARIALVKLIVR